MHLSSLQREKEMRFRKNIPKNFSATSFTPMQSEGFRNSKWAGFFRPTGYKPMIMLFFLFLIQQFSGIYITLFYAVTFLQVSLAITFCSNAMVKQIFLIYVGNSKKCRCVQGINFCWSYTTCDVFVERLAFETI